jgi:multiple sugar transport system substrate-binding protein
MLAASEAWGRVRPGVEIEWSFRSLASFGDQPIGELANRFDLLVIDHPFVGTAAATGCLVPVEELLPPATLAELAEDAIGLSHHSYAYGGSQWALAADAACQVAVARDDLLEQAGCAAPATWGEVRSLAAALPSRVAMPLHPIDAICSLLTICAGLDSPAGAGESFFVSPDEGERAVGLLAELVPLLHTRSLEVNPPQALDLMCDTDEIVYMPLVFGYTNYSRPEGGRARLRFLDVPSFGHAVAGALLGGAGLAVSSASREPAEAAAFAAWVCGRQAQADVVFAAGGQPASRSAWLDERLDAASGGFFSGTRASIEAAYLRPREPWWPRFQEQAGHIVARLLRHGEPPSACVARLEALYDRCRHMVETPE